MKLSEMNTEQLAGALCSLAGPLSRMAEDQAAAELIERILREEKTEGRALRTVWRLAAEAGPALMQRHLEDMCAVASVMTGVAKEEIRAQNGLKTLCEMRECMEEELTLFFGYAGSMARAGY